MASRKTYACFVCQKNGFEDVQVFLDGKDENGRTKYLNEDMSPHRHNILITKQQSQHVTETAYPSSSSVVTQSTEEQQQLMANITSQHKELMDKMQNIESKMDRIAKLIYAITGEQQKDYNLLDNR